jgi:hypothetical protein
LAHKTVQTVQHTGRHTIQQTENKVQNIIYGGKKVRYVGRCVKRYVHSYVAKKRPKSLPACEQAIPMNERISG